MQDPLFELFVPGRPAPGGSKTAYRNRHSGKVALVDAGKGNGDWKARVALAAREAWTSPPLEGALMLRLDFHLVRPKGHFGLGKNAGRLKTYAPTWPTSKPDLTKLLRAVEDALTGIVWRDDCLIVWQFCAKQFGPTPGVKIVVARMEE